MKLHTLQVWNAVTALAHYSVVWTSVVKCLTLKSRPRSKVKFDLWGHKVGHGDLWWPRDLSGHKLGQTDHKGHRELLGKKVGHVDL